MNGSVEKGWVKMDGVRLLEAIGKMMDEKLEKMFDERLEIGRASCRERVS